MNLIAILERFGHHNPQTSPDNMVNYIAYDHVLRPSRDVGGGPLVGRLDALVRKAAGMTGYNIHSLKAELALIRRTATTPTLVHFFNGDINCRFFPGIKGSSVVLSTYHQPPDFFFQFFKKTDHIRRLDGVLVTSNYLRDLMGRFVSDDRIHFQPLSVDTDLFRPAEHPADKSHKVCIMVGNWLRDFECAQAVTERLSSRPDIEFRVISLEVNRKYFQGCANVRFFSGLPLRDYIGHLQEADLMMLPLRSGTSNLAVLEAMAVGLPVVTNRLPGTADYVDESFCALLENRTSESFANAVSALANDPAALSEMAERARKRAEHFAWSRGAEKLAAIYRAHGVDPHLCSGKAG